MLRASADPITRGEKKRSRCIAAREKTSLLHGRAAGGEGEEEDEGLQKEGKKTGGMIKLTRGGEGVRMEGTVTGLEPGAHGFHLHAKGECSAPDGSSAGDHFEPADDPHGAPEEPPDQHHLGDFGNITAGENGGA